MKIAVIMSVFNGEKFINKQLESIFNQTCSALVDIYVRDDGSSDGTVEILEKYSKLGKIKYFKGNNLKLRQSQLWLLNNIGDYDFYALADSDDIWYKDKLVRGLHELIKCNKPAIYGSNGDLIDQNDKFIGRRVYRNKPLFNLYNCLLHNSICMGPTIIMNRKLVEIIRAHDNSIFKGKGSDALFTALCYLIGGEVIYSNDSTFQYRVHTDNASGYVVTKNSIWKAVKSRIDLVFNKRNPSLATETRDLMTVYGDLVCDDFRNKANIIIFYKKNVFYKLKLFFDISVKWPTFNLTVVTKLRLLLNNL